MKTFKIVIGIVLIIASLVTMSEVSGSDTQGAGLTGSITGFLLIGGLGIWLIYSGSKSDK